MALLIILGVLVSLALVAVSYYLLCIPQERMAAKLDEHTTWMAYVPIARNVQRMRMTGMPMSWMFFVGSSFTFTFGTGVLSLVGALLMALNTIFGAIVAGILLIAYSVFFVIGTYRYNFIISEKFGFHHSMALVWMFLPPVGLAITYLIALSDRFFVGAPKQTSTSNASGSIGSGTANIGGDVMGKIGLEGVSGMYMGAEFPMSANEPLVIGRDGTLSNVIVSTNSEKVSRRHCTVRFIPATNSYEITDHSTNGTFYGNTRLVKDSPTSVVRGTTIVIGDKINQFKLL